MPLRQKFTPIKCIENDSWLPLAIEYNFFIQKKEKRTQTSPPKLRQSHWDKNKIQRNLNTLHTTPFENSSASFICPLRWVFQSVLGVVQVLFCQLGWIPIHDKERQEKEQKHYLRLSPKQVCINTGWKLTFTVNKSKKNF